MILIISDENDRTTNNVIYWLSYFKSKFIRVNDTSRLSLSKFCLANGKSNIKIINENVSSGAYEEIDFNEIKAVWYRRGFFKLKIESSELVTGNNKININDINLFLSRERNAINGFFKFDLFYQNPSIGKEEHNLINKLYILREAMRFGIDIPETHIVSRREDLFELVKQKEYITKSASDAGFIMVDNMTVMGGFTCQISYKELSSLNEDFFPSLIQQKIEKEFDLRIFYLNSTFYCAAIISQNDSKTQLDFRNYNKERPNRILPFTLPQKLSKKLKRLLNRYNYNACSIDIIVGKDGKYYFLEINPVGQFEFIGYPCNYYLDKKVALELINLDN